mmetsp:Transcript_10960/g.19826  ORF Transcript_10960/g.19826 Transcript_10960/m.19826 type:complete len:624 (-) Transcript_10960:66-1937(-)
MDQSSTATLSHRHECMQGITKLLVDAGYSRAGDMAAGEEFDKVVGGLSWLITSTLTTPLDISLPTLLEATSISTRIALSEVLHSTLLKMELPVEISPHQIQGVDAPVLLPVVRWAVKNFTEKRVASGDSILGGGGGVEFTKYYDKGFGGLFDGEEIAKNVEEMQERYKVKGRKYRFKGSQGIETEEQKVHRCLLEYGEKMRSYRGLRGGDGGGEEGGGDSDRGFKGRKKISAFDKQLADAQKVAEEEEKALEEARERMAAQLMNNSEELNDEDVAGRGGVGGLVTLGRGEIGVANEEYEKLREKMLKERKARDEKKELFNSRKSALEREIAEGKKLLEKKGGEVSKAEKARAEMQRMRTEVQDEKANNAKISEELQRLSEIEASSGQKDLLKSLWALVQENEKVKKDEKHFKEECKKKMDALTAALQNMGDDHGGQSEEEKAKMHEIDSMHVKILSKHDKVRQLLAQRNLQVASTTRKIDDVPTRMELIQYERRFVELYQQVALKLEETRRYYATYNTLDSTRNFLSKEVKLIDSITNNFENAMKTKSSQEEFLQQFEAILKGVQDSLSKQDGILRKRQEEVSKKEVEYTSVIEDQRRYFKLVKDFQEECNKNEALGAKIGDF